MGQPLEGSLILWLRLLVAFDVIFTALAWRWWKRCW